MTGQTPADLINIGRAQQREEDAKALELSSSVLGRRGFKKTASVLAAAAQSIRDKR